MNVPQGTSWDIDLFPEIRTHLETKLRESEASVHKMFILIKTPTPKRAISEVKIRTKNPKSHLDFDFDDDALSKEYEKLNRLSEMLTKDDKLPKKSLISPTTAKKETENAAMWQNEVNLMNMKAQPKEPANVQLICLTTCVVKANSRTGFC
ncbi:uncharacterized protein LOC114540685 [Dendronephthya gigantea]|uniref:uncharacterized protein LOC114540685 n=1 Tax=Dendronephthya gigantea TaxID=151771 RepID=UPI00106CFD42|nr:uncharacterized protein LOC114540685 [Dendronephthya gigantea]